ncbi:MAG: cytochrome c [Methylococcales bacterium]|nr:cytochrome c [Methylococcales bacterium]MDD5754793.1 cytochrome c [Methylococcales bacterium]
MKKLLLLLCISSSCLAAEPVAERQTEIRALLQNSCGGCHGATLQGAMGPPLKPEALASKTDELLITTITNGRKGTAMASWKSTLEPDEIKWLVGVLKSGK